MNIMFKPQYHDRIRAGTKITTLRPPRAEIKIGTHLSLRGWSGKAYRSPQFVVAEAACVRFTAIEFNRANVKFADTQAVLINGDSLDAFAVGDGFDGWADMIAAFEAMYGAGVFPFYGVLIGWKLEQKESKP